MLMARNPQRAILGQPRSLRSCPWAVTWAGLSPILSSSIVLEREHMTLTPLKPKVRKLRLKHVAQPTPVVRLRLKQPCKRPVVTRLRLKQKAPARVFHEVVMEDGFACYRSTSYADALAILRKWQGRGNKAYLQEIPYFERDERGHRLP